MTFKAKLSKQGNSYCIYVPKQVRTLLEKDREYEWSVRTDVVKEEKGVRTEKPMTNWPKVGDKVPVDKPEGNIAEHIGHPHTERKRFNTKWCKKHDVFMGSCGCK